MICDAVCVGLSCLTSAVVQAELLRLRVRNVRQVCEISLRSWTDGQEGHSSDVAAGSEHMECVLLKRLRLQVLTNPSAYFYQSTKTLLHAIGLMEHVFPQIEDEQIFS